VPKQGTIGESLLGQPFQPSKRFRRACRKPHFCILIPTAKTKKYGKARGVTVSTPLPGSIPPSAWIEIDLKQTSDTTAPLSLGLYCFHERRGALKEILQDFSVNRSRGPHFASSG
jgi:hypothetical protein